MSRLPRRRAGLGNPPADRPRACARAGKNRQSPWSRWQMYAPVRRRVLRSCTRFYATRARTQNRSQPERLPVTSRARRPSPRTRAVGLSPMRTSSCSGQRQVSTFSSSAAAMYEHTAWPRAGQAVTGTAGQPATRETVTTARRTLIPNELTCSRGWWRGRKQGDNGYGATSVSVCLPQSAPQTGHRLPISVRRH
jgi:hypothetical protein